MILSAFLIKFDDKQMRYLPRPVDPQKQILKIEKQKNKCTKTWVLRPSVRPTVRFREAAAP